MIHRISLKTEEIGGQGYGYSAYPIKRVVIRDGREFGVGLNAAGLHVVEKKGNIHFVALDDIIDGIIEVA